MKIRHVFVTVWVGLCCVVMSVIAQPIVSNVVAQQRVPTKLVDITYDLASSGGTNLYIGVEISLDGGVTYDTSFRAFTGDGYGWGNVAPGLNKLITWDAGAEWNNKYTPNAKARITASETPFQSIAMRDEAMRNLLDLYRRIEEYRKVNGRLPVRTPTYHNPIISNTVRFVSANNMPNAFWGDSGDYFPYVEFLGKTTIQRDLNVDFNTYDGYWFKTHDYQYNYQLTSNNQVYGYAIAVSASSNSPAPSGAHFVLSVINSERIFNRFRFTNSNYLVSFKVNETGDDPSDYKVVFDDCGPYYVSYQRDIYYPCIHYADHGNDYLSYGFFTYRPNLATIRNEAWDFLADLNSKIQNYIATYGILPELETANYGRNTGRFVSSEHEYFGFANDGSQYLDTPGKAPFQVALQVGYNQYQGLAFDTHDFQYCLVKRKDSSNTYAYGIACVGPGRGMIQGGNIAEGGSYYAMFVRKTTNDFIVARKYLDAELENYKPAILADYSGSGFAYVVNAINLPSFNADRQDLVADGWVIDD